MNNNKIIDMHEDIMHSLISLNCEMIRDSLKSNTGEMTGEEKLKNDIEKSKTICPMNKCRFNVNGQCINNGLNLLESCRSNNYAFYEEDIKKLSEISKSINDLPTLTDALKEGGKIC